MESAAWIKKRMSTPHIISCGCENFRHGMSETPTYKSWHKMCARTRSCHYIYHFGIVSLCAEWDATKGGSFENFYRDMGERPEGTSINRVNGSSIYSKETCEWASLSLQAYDQCRRKNNTSGRTGVQRSWKGNWLASIKKNGVTTTLYYGPSKDEAIAARDRAEIALYGFHRNNEQTHVKSPE